MEGLAGETSWNGYSNRFVHTHTINMRYSRKLTHFHSKVQSSVSWFVWQVHIYITLSKEGVQKFCSQWRLALSKIPFWPDCAKGPLQNGSAGLDQYQALQDIWRVSKRYHQNVSSTQHPMAIKINPCFYSTSFLQWVQIVYLYLIMAWCLIEVTEAEPANCGTHIWEHDI